MRSLLSANPDKRLQVAQAALLLPVPRTEFLNILQEGAALGWWTVDAEGWLRL
jgi:hypothetical protein